MQDYYYYYYYYYCYYDDDDDALKIFVIGKDNSKLHGEKLVFRLVQGKQDIKFTDLMNICKFINCSSFFLENQSLILTALNQT